MMRRTPLRAWLARGAIACIILLIAGYGLFEARKLIEGPRLSIDTPRDGETLYGPLIRVAGSVQNTSFLSVNGAQVFADGTGHFETDITPPPGYAIFSVVATDRFGRTHSSILHVWIADFCPSENAVQ